MIRTFIFFDLETTGLIGKNFMPKVTEMSLIAVSRNAICDTTDILPRVLHKLILPIHPNVRISEGIETLTGLSNTNLEEVQHFNCEVYNLIINFVKRQIAPICFVAYNGNKFDYPIFLSELKNINKNFCEDILSIDMLHLIKEFFSTKQSGMEINAAYTATSNSFRAENKRGAIARRKLDFTNSKPTNFKLSSVCKHIFGTDPENIHNAEGDCLSMIRCATQLGNSFVQWADYKAVPLINHSKQ
ncbi:Three prime repair exonuclease 2 [Anthophora quadrimaculata]